MHDKPIFRRIIVPLATFLAGIGSITLTESFTSYQQLLHEKRTSRVAILRDYATACYNDAAQYSELANLPLHFRAIEEDSGLSPKERSRELIRVYWESTQRTHQTARELAAKTEIVNALFETKVDPIGIVMQDVPPEFTGLPGEVDPQKLIDRIKKRTIGHTHRICADAWSAVRNSVLLLSAKRPSPIERGRVN